MSSEPTEHLLVTEYFHPDTASTGQLMTDLAVGLKDRGLDMTVYTGQPNYHSGENERQPSRSLHEGVSVRRIGAPQVRQSSMPRRLVNWALFTAWMTVLLLFERVERDRKVIFVTCPPFLPAAMWFVCRVRGWEYTYVAYDLYPDEPVELGYVPEGGLVHRLWERLDRQAFRDAEHVVALGPVMKERIAAKLGPSADPEKIEIIHNWEDEDFITPMAKTDNWFSEEHGLTDTFTVLYSGNIAEFHDLETLVGAAAELDDREVQFLIIGEGDNKQRIIDLAEEHGLRGDSVEFLPYQPWDDLPYSLTSADVSVVAVKEGFEGIVVSSKLYTAMAAGQPVLVIAQDDDDEARIVDQFDAGISVEQGAVEDAAAAIERWRTDPQLVERQGTNAREAFEANFVKDTAIDQYYEMLAPTAQSKVVA
ncbi:glycosyltransferase family 4 protein [Haloarcula onubensis]|uniref:Glycosyltransferase family 4 protein n=1 Tax=Haloarcula onubensis TaxID=2950539 RepID=A0ABU2FWB8_9EURY|nr:glycosyltransferase family 4 protein [Halomicroarcula sp. S3CR25-11]MDS0284531.1 glycosyltransferase family 4 protein [Halomicroarcula sp. S3CR25-11]